MVSAFYISNSVTMWSRWRIIRWPGHPGSTVSIHSCVSWSLPCDALRCTVFVIVRNSVRLSVRPSVTLVDCVHMVRPTIVIYSPYGSPIILVSGDITIIQKFEGGHPERGRWMRVGWVQIGDFRPTRRAWQSQTWDRPAPQIRVKSEFI